MTSVSQKISYKDEKDLEKKIKKLNLLITAIEYNVVPDCADTNQWCRVYGYY